MCEHEAENVLLREENRHLKEQLNDLHGDVEYLKERLAILSKMLFGKSSERSKRIVEDNDAQLLLDFGDDIKPSVPVGPEPETVTVPEHRRRKRAPRTLSEAVNAAEPIEVVENTLEGNLRKCPDCGRTMSDIGVEKRRHLVYIPMVIGVCEEYCHKYACQHCKTHSDRTPIVEAPMSSRTLPGSYASAELIAHIASQKYVMASPLYRLEKEFARHGFPLSRQTMSNWLIQATAKWLEPIAKLLRKKIKTCDILFGDETPWRVLRKETGEPNQGKDYIWLLRTGNASKQQIVIYEYCPNRSSSNPKRLLEGFKGYLHTDGYSGYHNLDSKITVVGCWAHARRKFNDALMLVPEDKRPESAAAQALAYCNKLFALERKWKDLTPEQRYERRQSEAKPILEEFKQWIGSQNAVPKTHLGKALKYVDNQWEYLIRYIDDGRLEISNNRAERSIKPLVIDRKNFLFSNTAGGAECSAIMMTLIETAIENGLDPYKYLAWVFKTAPDISYLKNWEERLLPWNTPERCRSLEQK